MQEYVFMMFSSPIDIQTKEIKIINKKTNEVEIIKEEEDEE